MSHGMGEVHFWRERVRKAWDRRDAWPTWAFDELADTYIAFSVAHLAFCLMADELRDERERTGEVWPEGFFELYNKAALEMRQKAEAFLDLGKKVRGVKRSESVANHELE